MEKSTPLAKILTAAGSDGSDKSHLCLNGGWAFPSPPPSLLSGKLGQRTFSLFEEEEKMANVTLREKLKMVAIFSLVFALANFFRVGCLASTTFAADVP